MDRELQEDSRDQNSLYNLQSYIWYDRLYLKVTDLYSTVTKEL